MTSARRRVVAIACLLLCGAAAIASWSLQTGYVRTEDRNHDGRPDLWRFYDGHGQLTRTSTDTNFDGRSDQEEYYDDGHIARRLSDRNFDDRVDIVEEFDASTHEHIRSVVDVDFDGRADLLVLLQDGKPVFVKSAPPAGPLGGSRDIAGARLALGTQDTTGALAPLVDPFRGDTSLRSSSVRPRIAFVALTSIAGRLTEPVRAGPPDRQTGCRALPSVPFDATPRSTRFTRGPPSASVV